MLPPRSVTAAAVTATLLPAAACEGPPTPMTAPTPRPEKFNQTWTTNYGKTTCRQWFSVMTGHETFVAAADMLVNARATSNKNAAPPSDDLINSFKAEIDQACHRLETITIIDAAAGVYMGSDGRYAP